MLITSNSVTYQPSVLCGFYNRVLNFHYVPNCIISYCLDILTLQKKVLNLTNNQCKSYNTIVLHSYYFHNCVNKKIQSLKYCVYVCVRQEGVDTQTKAKNYENFNKYFVSLFYWIFNKYVKILLKAFMFKIWNEFTRFKHNKIHTLQAAKIFYSNILHSSICPQKIHTNKIFMEYDTAKYTAWYTLWERLTIINIVFPVWNYIHFCHFTTLKHSETL